MTTVRNLKNLGAKLKAIREWLGYTQEEMAEAVGKEGVSRRSRVHEWEKGLREPDLTCLLAYARLVSISTDDLLDDAVELQLQQQVKHTNY
ncbi:MAG: helix-turn-helix domain-containing protein [Anaerolineae bacterium]|nr:helix-turn-helix domain-containing protein [Anaerolineae bacterium]